MQQSRALALLGVHEGHFIYLKKNARDNIRFLPFRKPSMSNVLPFKRKSLKDKHKGKTLCQNGFHKWEIVTQSKFDVKKGKLVTLSRCKRCHKEKTELC